MNNPFEYRPSEECAAAFSRLVAAIEALKESDRPDDRRFCRELDEGKMLGVLIAADESGAHHALYAFSGQIGNGGFRREGFVGPVFDYLQPDGYFKTREAEISMQNRAIARFERGAFADAKAAYERARAAADAELAEFRQRMRRSKAQRDARRESGAAGTEERAAMVSQSQYEKAELRRMKKRAEADLAPLDAKMNEAQAQLDAMKQRRRSESEALQQWLFENFTVFNALGETASLSEIFAATPMKIPPSGAGECCAPKLLQEAYRRGWQPLSIAEYWYGKPKGGEVRLHGAHYPACRGKCGPLLAWMTEGLTIDPPIGSECSDGPQSEPEIIYADSRFCVVNKPAGMLSVPGKGRALSVEEWLATRYGRPVRMVHRLDQDTSGLLIAALGAETHKLLQSLFATRRVSKEYVAELLGDYEALGRARCGRISLPLAPDPLDRPRQRVDPDGGKEAVTDYEFTAAANGLSRITFRPLTGRTHQLRIHAASACGLAMPIAGDRLYGRRDSPDAGRLRLHARRIEFTFPADGRRYAFSCPVPF